MKRFDADDYLNSDVESCHSSTSGHIDW